MTEIISGNVERNRRLAAAAAARPKVDANGRPLTRRQFHYDAYGKLVSIGEEEQITDPAPLREYDGHGRPRPAAG